MNREIFALVENLADRYAAALAKQIDRRVEEMNDDDLLKLQIIFNNNKLELNDCLKKSLEIIAEITDYTSVVL